MKFIDAEKIYRAPGSRRGLPAWTYHNAELTRLELEEVFLKSWMFVAHISDIPRAGDYQCFEIGDERAVAVRGQDGEVRAFHNQCRHRASRVVADDKGHCGKAMICPFHGWSYNLDGSLRNIPRADTFPDIDPQEFGLKPLDCEIWQGMIFLRFGGSGPSVAEQFAEAAEEVGLYRIEDMKPLDAPWRYDFELDWKAVLDIDSEGYHVPVGHPELFDLVGASYTDQVTESGLARAYGLLDQRRHRLERNREYVAALPEESYLPESHRNLWIYWGMFPGFVVTLFPDQVEIYQSYPVGSQHSVMAGATYALPDDRPQMKKARALNREINMSVGDEDVQLVKWAAEGMRSSAFEGAMLSDLELGVAALQNRLREILPVVGLPSAPEGDSLREVNERLRKEDRVAAAS
ncbi:MAG: aromatic ring-hydroxylating dioxygenase subunit alpha [Gammaproteobacteria bacterium]|jgi:phenylpropionate dioxygenase-like ring-hydroxylating dioxygenase large terminal subunit